MAEGCAEVVGSVSIPAVVKVDEGEGACIVEHVFLNGVSVDQAHVPVARA